MDMNLRFTLHHDVQKALDQHQPIVALESTIITHGLPYPENVAMAKKSKKLFDNTVRFLRQLHSSKATFMWV